MKRPAPALDAEERFARAERNGLRLAIFCRTLVAGIALAGLLGYSFLSDYDPRIWGIVALLLFTGVGVAHLLVIGSRYDRWWIKYAIYALDILGICSFFVLIPISRSAELPQIIAFRAYGIYYLFPLLVLSALSLSWRLVTWCGLMAVLGWWAAYLWIVDGMSRTLSWSDIPENATLFHYETIFLSIDFIGWGNRVEESALLLAGALILALVVYRARTVFFAQIRAEAAQVAEQKARQDVIRTFGRFVPEEIVDDIISDAGAMAPRTAYGTALVLDIENFTGFASQRPPAQVIESLNTYLAWAADVIGERKGVVISFTGDGLLATFNTPIGVNEPEERCLEAARTLMAQSQDRGFGVRIGIASGDIASGSVGSQTRIAFTVYGDTVNRAARLEALCKTLGQSVIMDSRTARGRNDADIQSLGEQKIRGYGQPIAVFSL